MQKKITTQADQNRGFIIFLILFYSLKDKLLQKKENQLIKKDQQLNQLKDEDVQKELKVL